MRATGFYWVRLLGNTEWTIAYYESPYFKLMGTNCIYTSIHFEEIDESRLFRVEPFKPIPFDIVTPTLEELNSTEYWEKQERERLKFKIE